MSRSRAIGTAAESKIVKEAKDSGFFPNAMRLPLSGHLDKGDVLLTPGEKVAVYIESKAGDKAKKASDNQIRTWLEEHKAALGPGDLGFLVIPRVRRSVAYWWAVDYEPGSSTRIVFRWLRGALEAQLEALQAKAADGKVYGDDPKVNFHPTEPVLARVPVRDVVVEYEADEDVDPRTGPPEWY